MSPTVGEICDMAFHDGRLYAICRNGIILVSILFSDADLNENVSLSVGSQVVLDRIPCRIVSMDMDMHYYPGEILVESCGELLLVEQRRRPRSGCYGSYELIKVDF